MRQLYVRIAWSVMLAVIAGCIAAAILIPRMRDLMEQGMADQLVAVGFGSMATRLDASPLDTWPAQLATAQRDIAIPLTIIERDTLPAGSLAREGPFVTAAAPGQPISLYIPLRRGTHYLVAGPLAQPSAGPFLSIALVFVIVLTVTASAVVGIPLVRRLRTIRDALAAIGGGNWATRLDANAESTLRELAESVNVMATQLEQQFRERETLLQAVSHEMGTPLSRMRFQLERLENSTPGEARQDVLDALSADLDELDELSSELVSWMESDAPVRPRRSIDVKPLLESLAELAKLPGDSPVEPRVTGVDATILADERQFQRAMENLLRNAARYASSRIVVNVSHSGQQVAVEVRDDGPGIPPEDRARVLQPFVRGTASPERGHRGLGLGLAIVRRIVDAHGGSLDVAQAPEGGAAFRTTWPSAT